MAIIIGTDGNDILRGTEASVPDPQLTEGNDDIRALGGNDLIIGSTGSDVINGGAGKDTLDYVNFAPPDTTDGININVLGSTDIIVGKDGTIRDNVTDVEIIIGNPNRTNTIFAGNGEKSSVTSLDVDLSKNKLTYSSPQAGTKTLTVKNFTNIFGSGGSDKLKGNDLDNNITSFGNNALIIGSKGNDILNGKNIDYSNLGTAVTVSPLFGKFRNFTFLKDIRVDKDSFGRDQIPAGQESKEIIGATGKDNTISGKELDASISDSIFRLEVNLAKNFLKVFSNIKNEYKVVNFTNVVGTKNNDTIVGTNKKGKLTGGGGNDTITGGNKNDIITGSDSTARGVGEVDTLTGGGGRDKFVLGDKNGAYYVGKGKDDYATITDFNLFQDSIDLGGFKNYSFASAGNNTIELYSGKDVNTRDLIAKVQLAGGISPRSSNSRSMMGADVSLNAITSNIDILSGSSSAADA